MPYERISKAQKKTVGAKQTAKAVDKGRATLVLVARDADRHVVDPIIKVCREKDIDVIEIDSMKKLGKACGIEVRCAVAAVIK